MAWIVTGITLATGIYGAVSSSKSASKANERAEQAQQSADNLSEKELEFAQKQYDDWKNLYGPLEQNLTDYYNKLSPSYIEARNLENYEKEKNVALKNIRENLAQRGISTSGISGYVETSTELAGAEARAQIRADAPMQAAKEKASFLSIGLGQKPSGRERVMGKQTQAALNLANTYRGDAETRRQEANQAIGDATETALGILTDKVFG